MVSGDIEFKYDGSVYTGTIKHESCNYKTYIEAVLDTGASFTAMNVHGCSRLLKCSVESLYNLGYSWYVRNFKGNEGLERSLRANTANGSVVFIPARINNVYIGNVYFKELFFMLDISDTLDIELQKYNPVVLIGLNIIRSGDMMELRENTAVIHNFDFNKYQVLSNFLPDSRLTLYLNEGSEVAAEQESFQPDQTLILDSKPIGVQDVSSDIISVIGEYNTEYKTGIAEEELSAGKRLKTAFDKMDVLMEEFTKDISNSSDSTEE